MANPTFVYRIARIAVGSLLTVGVALAQTPPLPEQPAASRPVIPVWPDKVPGAASADRHESSMRVPGRNVHIVRNVTVPTLTLYLPKSGNPSKTAVIIAPGGGFRVLAIDEEGYGVADWFVQRGIAAFVLKYRLAATPGSDEEFMPSKPPAAGTPAAAAGPVDPTRDPLPKAAQLDGIADGIQAIRDVRAQAAKWGIATDRIVFVGFSAGGVVTSGALLAKNPADRPNYAAAIYGAPFGDIPPIPGNTPPAFLAVAEDDPVAAAPVLKFFGALRDAKTSPELHVYRSGNHGFSMNVRNSTSDHWIDELFWWMESYGLTKP